MRHRLIDRFFIRKPRFREIVTGLVEGDRDLDVSIFGTSLRINTVREHGYLRAYRKARDSSLLCDELPVLLNLAMLLEQGDTFVDVGANVGVFTCTLARVAKLKDCRFYAYEANPDTYARLIRSVGTLPVRVEQIAISNCEDSATFVGGAVSHVFTAVEHASSYNIAGRNVVVPTRRLDALAITGTSLVIKIDVEGQEREVLEGAAGLFAENRVRAVYLDGYKDPSVVSMLRGHGMRLLDGRSLALATESTFSLLAIR